MLGLDPSKQSVLIVITIFQMLLSSSEEQGSLAVDSRVAAGLAKARAVEEAGQDPPPPSEGAHYMATYGSLLYQKLALLPSNYRRVTLLASNYCPGTSKGRICRISLYSRVSQILPKYLIYPTAPTKGPHPPPPGPGPGSEPLGGGWGICGIWRVFGIPGNKD